MCRSTAVWENIYQQCALSPSNLRDIFIYFHKHSMTFKPFNILLALRGNLFKITFVTEEHYCLITFVPDSALACNKSSTFFILSPYQSFDSKGIAMKTGATPRPISMITWHKLITAVPNCSRKRDLNCRKIKTESTDNSKKWGRLINCQNKHWWYVVYSISFRTFCTDIRNCRRLSKIQYVIATYLMRWLTNLYDFRFKWTVTAGIWIHPTKAWFSQLVNFKNAIWTWRHFKRTIFNKNLF